MAKYRIKTREEFEKEGLLNPETNLPTSWVKDMEYLYGMEFDHLNISGCPMIGSWALRKEQFITLPETPLVFDKFNIGDVVVSLSDVIPNRKTGDIFSVLEKSDKNTLYYENCTSSTRAYDWRLATAEEAEAFKKGEITNVNQLKTTKPFTLPSDWCIKITKENEEKLKEWWLAQEPVPAFFELWLLSDKYDGTYLHYSDVTPRGYTPITFEQWIEHVYTPFFANKQKQDKSVAIPDEYIVHCENEVEYLFMSKISKFAGIETRWHDGMNSFRIRFNKIENYETLYFYQKHETYKHLPTVTFQTYLSWTNQKEVYHQFVLQQTPQGFVKDSNTFKVPISIDWFPPPKPVTPHLIDYYNPFPIEDIKKRIEELKSSIIQPVTSVETKLYKKQKPKLFNF